MIKAIRSNRYGKYYGRYIEMRQRARSLLKFLKKQGIISQYTIPSILDQNSVVKRRNRILQEIV